MKKACALVLVLVMILALAAGCTQPSTNQTTSKTETTASATTASAEPLAISMIVMGGPKTVNSAIEMEIEKRYNVELDLIFMPAWDEMATKTNLLMSDPSTMPDVVQWTGMDKEFKEWKDAGILVDMLPHLKEQGSEILNYYSKDTLFYSYEDGSMYKLPGDVAEASSGTIMIRGDWLKKLSLNAPKTTDEFKDVMMAFTNNDPDANGVQDTFGLGNIGMIYSAFKVNIDAFMLGDDGKVTYGSILPSAKEALAYIRDLYAAGAIDPNYFVNNDWQKDIERWTSGKVGCMSHGIHHLNPASSLNKAFYANNAGAEMVAIDPIKGPGGFSSTDVQDVGGWCFLSVTTAAKDPAGVVGFLNNLCTPEGFALYKFGVEGKHYEVLDGTFKPLMSQEELNSEGVNLLSWYLERKDFANIQNTQQVTNMFKRNLDLYKPMKEITVIFKNKNRPMWSEYAGDLRTLRDATFNDIILGKKDLSAFDEFVAQWMSQGGDKVIEEANQLYTVQVDDLAAFDQIYSDLIG